jgi:D-tyrosyl-tRNA(Tyr) deacylase
VIGLLQRVREARVRIAGEVVGEIDAGLLLLVCAERGDTEAQAEKLLTKLMKLRIFSDEQGKMNLSLQDRINAGQPAGLLIVSQFTLAADTSGGNRPSFTQAAPPAQGEQLYEALVERARATLPQVHTGRFGADMQVELVNDGPVTIPMRIAPHPVQVGA